MHALVTGATGFVGSHLVRELLSRGYSLSALVRNTKTAGVLPEQVKVFVGDLGNAGSLACIAGRFDVVFHLGAAISGDWGYHKRITVEGTRRLVEFAGKHGVQRFVLISSLAVYDKSHHRANEKLTERAAVCETLEAAGPYAWGKLEAERLVKCKAVAAGMEWVVARPGLIYGPGHLHFVHLGPRLGPVYWPFGGGGMRLPLVHIASVTDALVRLAEAPGASGGVFNIVDAEQPSKRRYVRELSEVQGRRVWCGGIPAWPLMAAVRMIEWVKRGGKAVWLPRISPEKVASRLVECDYSCAALRETTGWMPAHNLKAGLAASLVPLRVREPVSVDRVGIIGAGRMAAFHLRALKQIAGVQITGVLDRNLEAARELAARHRIPLATDDAREFYERARPQVVHVLTPPGSHARLALEAIRHGCHVFIEKPMVVSEQEGEWIAAAAQARGVTVGVDHNYALDPRVVRTRRLIDAGALGELVHIDVFWGFDIRRFHHILPANAGETTWAMELPGGLLEDLMPHPLSIPLALMREEVQLQSYHVFRSGRHPYLCDDEARLLLRGENGCTISINLTLSAKPDDLLVSVHGSRATVKIDVHNMTLTKLSLVQGPKVVARGICTVMGNLQPLMQTVRNVVLLALKRAEAPASTTHLVLEHYAALRQGRPLPVDWQDGQQVVQITRRLWPSQREMTQAGQTSLLSTYHD